MLEDVAVATTGARARLLEVAGALFYAEGIHAVGVDRVIAEAGVAKATLYAHFAGKDELVAAYLAARSAAWADEVERRAATSTGAGPRGLVPFDLLAERAADPGFRGCPFVNAAAEFPGPGLVAEVVAAHRRRVRAAFASLAGPGPVEALVVLYDGAMTAAHLDGDPGAVDAARALAASLLAAPGGAAPGAVARRSGAPGASRARPSAR